MFERRVRILSSYKYSSDLYERTLNKKHIVIYGASAAGKLMKDALVKAGKPPLFFWDINPNAKVEGFEVKRPDFDAIDEKDRADYLVIVAVDLTASGYFSLREKLLDYGYTDYIHSPMLARHMSFMNCCLNENDAENCKTCPHIYWQCFCLNEKLLGISLDKNKMLLPCLLSVKYESKEELARAAERCEKFCGYFNATQLVLIKYKELEACDGEFYSLISAMIERINAGIIKILCGKTETFTAELLRRLVCFKSRIHFLVDRENYAMLELLTQTGLTCETTENAEFKAKSLKDYKLQCADCVFQNNLYHLNGGNIIGFRCEEMFEAVSECGRQNTLDIDAENSPRSPNFAPKLENLAAAEYFRGKCGRKTIICRGV